MKKLKQATALLIVFILMISVATVSASADSPVRIGEVRVDGALNVRNAPGTRNSTVIDTIEDGTTVYITETVNDPDGDPWHHIYYDKNGENRTGYVYVIYVSIVGTLVEDETFDAYLDSQGFPASYKTRLQVLHATYPNWVFVAEHIEPDWQTVLAAETKFGRNMSSYLRPDSWKSVAPEAYNEETGTWTPLDGVSWVAASDEIIAYYLDPRNFLDDTGIFNFALHSFDESQTVEKTKKVVSGTFLDAAFPEEGYDTYSDAIVYASRMAGANPYVIASMIIVEQGAKGQGGCISGVEAGYEGYYNYLNVGAYTTSTMTAVQRGLWWAAGGDGTGTSYGRPWNSRLKSLIGSAQFYANDYLSVGQDTFYLKKFDVINDSSTGLYWHQYMANVEGGDAEASKLRKAYSEILDDALVFKIPVYSGMPEEVCQKPTETGTVQPRLLVNKIATLPEYADITEEDEPKIAGLREKYNSLSDHQKSMVTNLAVLEAAERRIDELQNGDSYAAKQADEAILDIGENITLDSAERIESARSIYDNLTAEAKALVKNLALLESAESTLAELRLAESQRAGTVIAGITALPETVTLEDGDEINRLILDYNVLHEYGKAIVGEYHDRLLEAYEQWIAAGGIRLGDMDGNGDINVSDVVALRQAIMNNSADEYQKIAGDMDGNGVLNVSDVVALRSFVMANT